MPSSPEAARMPREHVPPRWRESQLRAPVTLEARLRADAPEEEREAELEAGRRAKRIAQPATLGPFYSYAPPRMGTRLGDGEELKKCA